MVKEVASKTTDVAGDGTTTATVLAQSIIAEGLAFVSLKDSHKDEGIDLAKDKIMMGASVYFYDIPDSKQIAQVATVSEYLS